MVTTRLQRCALTTSWCLSIHALVTAQRCPHTSDTHIHIHENILARCCKYTHIRASEHTFTLCVFLLDGMSIVHDTVVFQGSKKYIMRSSKMDIHEKNVRHSGEYFTSVYNARLDCCLAHSYICYQCVCRTHGWSMLDATKCAWLIYMERKKTI